MGYSPSNNWNFFNSVRFFFNSQHKLIWFFFIFTYNQNQQIFVVKNASNYRQSHNELAFSSICLIIQNIHNIDGGSGSAHVEYSSHSSDVEQQNQKKNEICWKKINEVNMAVQCTVHATLFLRITEYICLSTDHATSSII